MSVPLSSSSTPTLPHVVALPALNRALHLRDLTDPAQGPHAMQLLVEHAATALSAAWRCQIRTVRSRPIVSLEDNYDRLGYAADAVARDVRYTRYVSDTTMLRSHTSAGVPPTLRRLAAVPAEPVLLVLPGICHRRDTIDRLHTGSPHQLDLWLLRPGGPRLDHDDLQRMVTTLTDVLLPGRHWRWTATTHPYTSGGREVEVIDHDHPVEIAECGLAAPAVLAAAGLDPRRWSGLALGMGLDRMLMLRKGVPDIRLLRSSDERVRAQMLGLEPYRPVSDLPPARRDLSIAVDDADDDAEIIGDRVRDALGERAELIEEVAIVSSTAYDDLPEQARRRLAMRPGQRNVLLRLVLRPVDRTLTGTEVNELRDQVYSVLHRGTRLSAPVGVSQADSP